MKTLRSTLMVFSLVVILGIVGCNNRDSRISDDTEITSQIEETTEETFTSTEETTTEVTATPTATATPRATATPKPTEEPVETEAEADGNVEATVVSQETTPAETQIAQATSTPIPAATQVAEPLQVSTDTPAPIATPVPTSTPAPTATPPPSPTPDPQVIDIDASAQANGYVAVDIDMGNGTTQRVYGYYVDMSELDSRVNDYRESIGMSRLPTDTSHVEEMKIRAVEASIPGYFSHQRPNGSWGSEANIVSGTDVNDCYQRLYESDGHRAAWEDEYATTIYSVGFRRMVFDESTGTWSGGGGATVQFTDYSF